jgi:hypothetical protein
MLCLIRSDGLNICCAVEILQLQRKHGRPERIMCEKLTGTPTPLPRRCAINEIFLVSLQVCSVAQSC